MIRRSQYRCSFKESAKTNKLVEACKERAKKLVWEGKLCNVSFYRHENMGFLYVEEITGDEPENSAQPAFDAEALMKELIPALKPWPREEGDVFFVPMINVYYHHIPDDDLKAWEHERTTAEKTRVGRIAFVFPDKMPSYVKHHTAIVEEGLLKGDKYQYISMHENILFSYYEEPRNNVNLSGRDEESKAMAEWLAVDPESHFDRVKAKGDNFLVIPCLFTVDRVDREFKSGNLWRCCYDPQTGRYTAETGGGPNHNLYEITKEIYDKVDTLENSEAERLIRTGRHLYMAVDDRCGPPYTVILDSDYKELCPWAKTMVSGEILDEDLTDEAVELFASEADNREQRRAKKAERERSRKKDPEK